ncbi:atypical chemokine receptor 2-like [Chiloscyllium plagiosum]|uniref:atypical chemokine receptor 2-like n=1 Tax=Chiloscyllium plagiosum TaxID=36176 RepID=UPI001CB8776D|nr:atypical chemokine receptor 2-like [Chiloscyllium plagiosum]XP_043546742.1 atypical chemokine receptor 2-like [Chiloscyllium plagiosum]XP_043546743.1 atypical chemokine receptor 2-like [Chiloscyllium plagiosum]XP_043546744.1 atypical chemokine receptor 2-like [Chiloscyllium plagiosum]XP_043546745.1 atypical chemokine receptor 2-like [Chiloscyllium plagiosum]
MDSVNLDGTSNNSSYYDEDYNYTDFDLTPYLPCGKDEVRAFGKIFLPVLYIMIFVFGVLGNSFLILMILKYLKLKTMTDIYLLNLAISDLLFSTSLPFWATYVTSEWIFGDTMCKIISALYSVNFYSGIFFIACMSLDMYLHIVHTVSLKNHRTIHKSVVISAAVWTLSIIVSIPELIFSVSKKIGDRHTCLSHFGDEQLVIWKTTIQLQVNIIAFLIPFFAMIFFYARIASVLLHSKSFGKEKALKLVIILFAVFFILWFPYNIVLFLHSLEDLGIIGNCEMSKRLDYALQVTESIAFTHCCFNPLLYAFVNERFRRHVKSILVKLIQKVGCNKDLGVMVPTAERSETSKQQYGVYSDVEMTMVQ